jgi:hypothetical protein
MQCGYAGGLVTRTGNDARDLQFTKSEIAGRDTDEPVLRDVVKEGLTVAGSRAGFTRLSASGISIQSTRLRTITSHSGYSSSAKSFSTFPTATARIRELSRGGRRKNDRIDAAAAACVAALQGDTRPVAPEGPDVLALLDERRTNLSNSRTRLINQLHALLRQLLAGGAPTSLTAAAATALLRGFRGRREVDRIRVGLCRDLIADIRRLDSQLAENEKQMAKTLDEHGTRLREVDGIVR